MLSATHTKKEKKAGGNPLFFDVLQHIREKEEEEKLKWKPQREKSRYTSPLSHTIVSLCLFDERTRKREKKA